MKTKFDKENLFYVSLRNIMDKLDDVFKSDDCIRKQFSILKVSAEICSVCQSKHWCSSLVVFFPHGLKYLSFI